MAVKYTCLTHLCKGSCCDFPGTLPLEDSEHELIANTGIPNQQNLERCNYSYKEAGITKCMFQRIYEEGLSNFEKPSFCKAYPFHESGYMCSGGLIGALKIQEGGSAIDAG